jgi:DNA transformation protein
MDPDFLRDLFQSAGPITIRTMFGGQGIYAQKRIFAVVLSDGRLFVKGDHQSGPVYEDRAMVRWTYTNTKSGKPSSMPYWQVPDSAFDNPDEMRELTGIALATAKRVAAR